MGGQQRRTGGRRDNSCSPLTGRPCEGRSGGGGDKGCGRRGWGVGGVVGKGGVGITDEKASAWRDGREGQEFRFSGNGPWTVLGTGVAVCIMRKRNAIH